jgi:hypothetical protein
LLGAFSRGVKAIGARDAPDYHVTRCGDVLRGECSATT